MTTDMCLQKNCLYERKEKKGNKAIACTQCTVCWNWYHDDCVGIKESESLGSWPCPTCRLMPTEVTKVGEAMVRLLSVVTTLTETVKDLKTVCQSSAQQLHQISKEYDEVKAVNERLRNEILLVRQMIENKKKEVFTESCCSHLVIGDSLLRSIDESKLQNTTVQCLQGADIADVLHHMNDTDDIYMDITICVGTNDCSNGDDFVPNALTDTYRQLVQAASEKVKDVSKVQVISIPPRTDDPLKQERVTSLNAGLCAVAEEAGAKFIDNDPVFKLRDGTPNDGYLSKDGIHLNMTGTNRLAKNMRLLVKEGHRGNVCKDLNSRDKSPGGWIQVPPHRNRQQRATNYSGPLHNNTNNGQRKRCWNCGENNHVSSNC